MKKTITILSLVITTLLLTFEAEASQLYLRTQSPNTKAFISGEAYFARGGEIFAGNLRSGSHMVSVKHLHRGNGRHHAGYGNRNNLLFRGRIFIPHRSAVYAHISRNGRLVIDQVVPQRNRNYNRGHRQYDHRDRRDDDRWDQRDRRDEDWRDRDRRDDGWNRDQRGREGDHRGNRDRDRHDRNWDEDRRGSNNGSGNRGNKAGRKGKFAVLIDMINDEAFESNKLALAKNFVQDHDMRSRDVLMLMKQMNYESSRLELAKFAYQNTVDKDNYFIVKQAFNYSSSSRRLDKFIR